MAGGGASPLSPMDVHLKTKKPPQYYLKIAQRWAPSAMGFGAFAGTLFLYFTDWRIFMDKVPIYRGKFAEKEPIV